MKIETYKLGTIEREVLGDNLSEITITTTAGAFSIHSRSDGALEIHESTHLRLAVHPRQANAIILEAVDPL